MADEKPIKLIPVVTPYAIAVCILYLFGYWSSFGINILEYASLSDVLKTAIYPALIGAIVVLSGTISRFILFDLDSVKEANAEKVFILASRKFIKWVSVIAFISIWPTLLLISDFYKWIWAGNLLGITLILSIDDIGMLVRFIPNPVMRRIIIIAAILVLSNSFGVGKVVAEGILTGGKRVKVVSTKIFKEKGIDLLKGQNTLKYLGATEDYFFFLSMDNTKTYIVKYSDLYFLELTDIRQK